MLYMWRSLKNVDLMLETPHLRHHTSTHLHTPRWTPEPVSCLRKSKAHQVLLRVNECWAFYRVSGGRWWSGSGFCGVGRSLNDYRVAGSGPSQWFHWDGFLFRTSRRTSRPDSTHLCSMIGATRDMTWPLTSLGEPSICHAVVWFWEHVGSGR